MAVMGVSSILYIRRLVYEVFLKLHLMISVGIVICLWLQTTKLSDFHAICLFVTTGLYCFEKLIWVGRVVFVRLTLRNVDQITVVAPRENASQDVTTIQVRSQRRRKITYGQHIFISVPAISHTVVGRFQAHPYLVAWEEKENSSQILTLLVAPRAGFSRKVRFCEAGTRIRVDGPYGCVESLESFDKVFFIASSIGLAAHLLAIRYLIQAHNDKTSRVRRLSLLWFLETGGRSSSDVPASMRESLTPE
jgi:predicted ferric reductase